jgi:hypothetical protein
MKVEGFHLLLPAIALVVFSAVGCATLSRKLVARGTRTRLATR